MRSGCMAANSAPWGGEAQGRGAADGDKKRLSEVNNTLCRPAVPPIAKAAACGSVGAEIRHASMSWRTLVQWAALLSSCCPWPSRELHTKRRAKSWVMQTSMLHERLNTRGSGCRDGQQPGWVATTDLEW